MSSSDMNPANGSPKLQFVRGLAAEESSDPERCTHLVSSSEMKPTTTTTPKHQSSAAHEESPASDGFEEVEEFQNSTTGRSNNFVDTITKIINEDQIEVPISIFKAPTSATSAKPEAYVPQLVGLGPVHYSRLELQHMQMYKVMEAKRIHNGFKSGLKFDKVVEILDQIAGVSIRASYNIYFDMEDDVLACVMAVDGLFLFHLLCCCRNRISNEILIKSSLSHVVNSCMPQEKIIQEAMMLENQIPIFVLKVILIIECLKVKQDKQKEIVSDLFPKILLGFCEYLSPLKPVEKYPPYKALKHAHLLDLLYHLVTLNPLPEWKDDEYNEELRSIEDLSKKVASKMPKKPETKRKLKSALKGSRFKSAQIVKNATEVLAQFVPLQFLQPIRLAQSFFDKLPQFRSTISAVAKEEVAAKKIFLFPTASELEKVGVMFFKAPHITDIKFVPATATFHLPSLKIDANFEVIIRNLAAYEAMIMSETQPPILNWYVELMNGLIETAEDVEVLEEIILKPESIDAERVAKIFNAMNKSVELKNIPDKLDKAVKSVKEHYTRETKETESTFMEKCRRTVSKWCQVFAVLLALFLLSVQTVCSVYDCPRFSFKTSNITPQAQQGLQLPSLRSHLM